MLSLTPQGLMNMLINVAPVRPVFIWGPPGIGKSAIVEQYAMRIGLPCVSLLGSQLAPEDLIGVPQIVDGKSRFCPPVMIARDEPYVLFLDELNACTPEVQKAFYSLIHDRRIGEYTMPQGSVVIGAGNRKQDKALARPIASALVNRLIHVELRPDPSEWINWGKDNGIHSMILKYVDTRPDHLLAAQALEDAPFSTPRSWHMLSDALHCYQEDELTTELIQVLASGCLSNQHAGQFSAFARNWLSPYTSEQILSGEIPIPFENVEEATFMIASVRAHLIERLPQEQEQLTEETEWVVYQTISLIEKIAHVDGELVRYFITPENEDNLPKWLVDEITDMWSDLLQVPEDTPPPHQQSTSPFRRSVPANNNNNSSPFSSNNQQRPGGGFFRRGASPQDDDDDSDATQPAPRPFFRRSNDPANPSQGTQP